jgi:type IV pilus assembly protein PilQ
VGDIAISTTDSSGATLDLGTNERVPRLVLRDAPVREVLSLLVRQAGLNVAFSADMSAQTGQGAQPAQPAQAGQAAAGSEGPRISLDIENESVQDVFNYVLRLSGLQANRIGRTIFVGVRLPNELRDVVIRSFRMNQVNARQAAGFLASMGAESSVTTTQEQPEVTATTIEGSDQKITRTSTRSVTKIEPLTLTLTATSSIQPILRGLQALVDERLNAVTLVGPRRLVEIAAAQLVQLDLRRRQVAVNVKIIDVNLTNTDNVNSSFSFGVGDSFFAVDQGAAAYNYGSVRPPTSSEVSPSVTLTNPATITNPYTGTPFINNSFFSPENNTNPDGRPQTSPPLDPNANPLQPGITDFTPGQGTTPSTYTYALPSLFQFPSKFLAALRAQITSGNAKILTDPTLVVQEGQQAQVNLTEDVVSNVQTQTTATTPPQVTQTATIAKAGLILGVQVVRIDDNGFITLSVTPKVTSVARSQTFSNTTISLLAERSLNSGEIRLRDGQTLILSGIIQEQDRTNVSKVPILGDLPIIGALFRKTTRDNNRAEVIVVMTPQIIDDSERSPFGYGYTPGRDVRPLIQRQGLPSGSSPNR